MRAYIEKLLNTFKTPASSQDKILGFFDNHFVLVSLVIAVLGITLAFLGYKLFKALLIIGGAIGAGFAVSKWLLPLFASKLPAVPYVKLSDVIIVVAAILGAIIGFKLRSLCTFLGIGAGAYFLAHGPLYAYFVKLLPASWTFINNSIVKIAISAVAALIIAIICQILFKFLFIAITSIGGMSLAALFLTNLVMIDMSRITVIAALGVGVVAGIVAIVVQYKANPKYRPIFR